MLIIEHIRGWVKAYPVITDVVTYLALITIILLAIAFLRRRLRKRIEDTVMRYKSQKAVEVFGYFIFFVVTILYFTGNIKDFSLAIGLLTAGITVTLQELILSVAGSFYIFFVGVYKPGDRIEIHGIKGDVIDIDSIYTSMMEIGEWVTSDNYTGRIVKLSNAFVFRGPVYNYSQDFPFVWDEFNLPIRHGSDIDLAKEIIVSVAQEQLSDYVKESTANWEDVVKRYYIEDAMVHPTLAMKLTDNWVEFNLRYIVDYKRRRFTQNQLQEAIGKRVRATNGKVELASATFEIVKIPPLNVPPSS